MAPRAGTPRKGLPPKEGGKATGGTIRVARPIAVAAVARPIAELLAKDPPAQMGSGDDQPMPMDQPSPPGLPCSGRCGRCNLHPCRLHGGV